MQDSTNAVSAGPELPISEEVPAEPEKAAVAPYSAFSKSVKWRLIALVSLAAFFSPIATNIFLPAIDNISRDLGHSVEQINLSITVFLVFQALTPAFWGSLADVYGRRIICLSTMAVFIASCIGLAFTETYWLLMLLRCTQATGGASLIAISQGITGDIASPSERAGYSGIITLGPNAAPAIGPILGAVLTQAFGWHSIFIFLATSAGVTWLLLLLFLPETLRAIVGDGSISGGPLHKPLYKTILRSSSSEENAQSPTVPKSSRRGFKHVKFLAPFRIIVEKDIGCVLLFNGLIYAVYYCILTSFASEFKRVYNLSTLDLGLCYIANGIGCILGAPVCRYILDRDFRIVAEHLAANAKTEEEKSIPKSRRDIRSLEHFPIEHARLRSMPACLLVFAACTLIYGWTTQYAVHISAPLITTFVAGIVIMIIFTSCGTLAVDCYPNAASSATASNNLMRCLLGAAGVSIITPLINAINIGPACCILTGVTAVAAVCGIVSWKHGQRWRQARARRLRGEPKESK